VRTNYGYGDKLMKYNYWNIASFIVYTCDVHVYDF